MDILTLCKCMAVPDLFVKASELQLGRGPDTCTAEIDVKVLQITYYCYSCRAEIQQVPPEGKRHT